MQGKITRGILIFVLSLLICAEPAQAQRAANQTCDSNLIDLVFAVDASGSVKEENWRKGLEFVRKVVSAFEVGPRKARIAFISYSTNAWVNFYLNDYQTQDAVLRHINENEIRWIDGWTNTREALEVIHTDIFKEVNGDRPEAPNVAIVITDGASNINPDQTVAEALKVHAAGITTLAVGITNNISIPELRGIASDPDEDNMFTLDSYEDLIKREIEISTRACETIPDCTGQADIVLALDTSGSIGETNWGKLKTFVKDLIRSFNIGTGAIRLAVLSFGNKVYPAFGFDEHKNQISAINAIDSIPWLDQETNTSGAFWYMREKYFRQSRNVQKIAVVITDGASNRDAARTIPEAELTKESGVEVFAIGIGDELNQGELEAISSTPTSTHVYNADDYDALQKIRAQVVEQTCDVVPGCEARADIMFLLDSSGSIKEANWRKVQDFVKRVINKLPVDYDHVRVGMILFGDGAELMFGLNKFQKKADILAEIDKLPWLNQNTNTSGAIKLMRQSFRTPLGDRPGVLNVGIVLTDGASTFDKEQTIPQANLAKQEGIRMFAIGVSDEVNKAELEGIASQPSSSYVFEVDTFDALQKIQKELIETSCEEDPTGACREGTDIVIMIDGSGSMGTDFQTMLKFVSNFLEDLDIDRGTTRVGVLVFSNTPDIIFHLNRYTKTQEMRQVVEKIKYPRGRTALSDGIKRVTEEMFTQNNGDRPDKKNIILIFTDGNSNNPRLTMAEASKAKAKGIHIIATAIGQWLNMAEIRGIVSDPPNINAFQVSKAQEVNNLRSKFRSYICNSVIDCDPCENGATCVDLINSYDCQCRPPYVGKHCNATCRVDADVAFLVDSSGSIGQENYEKVLAFVKDVLNNVNVEQSTGRGLRIALATYADNHVLRMHFNNPFTTRRALINAMNFDYTGGTTNTAGAIRFARESIFQTNNGHRSGKPKIAVLITDGRSNNREETVKEARLAKQSGITILTVAISNSVDQEELEAVTTDPDKNNIYRITDFAKLYEATLWLASSICNNQDECDSNPCRNGATCKDLINAHQCGPCPQGYTGRFCERGCDGRIDLAFVIDSSGSIHHERFREKVKPFLISIIDELDVMPSRTRIGAVTWSDDSQLRFYLNTHNNAEDVKQAIYGLPFLGKRTNTASALRRMTDQIYIASNGDRSDVPNLAIVLTDGNSNIDQENTIREAIRARLKGIHIIVIAIGKKNGLNYLEINGIASDPDSANVFFVERYNSLAGIYNQIVNSVCNDVNECNSNPCRNGGTCVDGLKQFQCICPGGRTGVTCERSCSRQLDLVMVIDRSGSVQERFQLQMSFARLVVQGLDFSFGRTRIGIVLFQDTANVEFRLDQYTTKSDILNAMAFVSNGGKTNTADGINKMRTSTFGQGGDRNGVDNVGLVITDGHSNINPRNTPREAQSARQSNIEMYAVGVGNNINENEINDIASDPDSNHAYTNIRNDNDVQRAASRLLDQLCA